MTTKTKNGLGKSRGDLDLPYQNKKRTLRKSRGDREGRGGGGREGRGTESGVEVRAVEGGEREGALERRRRGGGRMRGEAGYRIGFVREDHPDTVPLNIKWTTRQLEI